MKTTHISPRKYDWHCGNVKEDFRLKFKISKCRMCGRLHIVLSVGQHLRLIYPRFNVVWCLSFLSEVWLLV